MNVALMYLDALAGGGYPRDVRWLAGSLAAAGTSVRVVADDGAHHDGLGSARVIGPEEFGSAAPEFDVVHLWGMFSPAAFLLCRRRWSSGRFVITPAGQLMPAHLRRRWWKKVPYLAAMQPLLARDRHVAHFFSDAEADRRARRVLHGAGAFEASLGVFPAPAAATGERSDVGDYLLFFGRNDVHQKGIDLLLTGYAGAVARGLRVPLIIAGQPDGRSRDVLANLIAAERVSHRVELIGEVSETQKWRLLERARSLVFLSRWDGPPRPIREAIAAGTPAIVSEGTNMGGVIRSANAGISVGSVTDEVASGLLLTEDEDRMRSWRRGAEGLGRALAWDRVAERFQLGYGLALDRVA